MLFLDCEGVIHPESLPRGQRENEEYYLNVMKRPRGTVRSKRPDLWRGRG
jgi:hypothetical protein